MQCGLRGAPYSSVVTALLCLFWALPRDAAATCLGGKGLKFPAGVGARVLAGRVTQECSRERGVAVQRKNIVWGGALLFLNSHSSAHVTDGCHQQ